MRAHVDGYSQANIELTKNEAESLYRAGKLEGKIQQISAPINLNRALPLILRVSRAGWRAEGLPLNKPLEKKKSYEIDLPPDGPEKILQGKVIGAGMPTIRLRKVYISLDGVY